MDKKDKQPIDETTDKNKKVEIEQRKTEDDFQVWFPPLEFIETIKGERIQVPVLSADKEAKAFQCLARLLEKLPKKKNFNLENLGANDLLDLAPRLLKEAPQEAFSLAGTLLEKDPKWIGTNLDFEKILGLILPFVSREAKLFGKIGNLFQKLSPLANL